MQAQDSMEGGSRPGRLSLCVWQRLNTCDGLKAPRRIHGLAVPWGRAAICADCQAVTKACCRTAFVSCAGTVSSSDGTAAVVRGPLVCTMMRACLWQRKASCCTAHTALRQACARNMELCVSREQSPSKAVHACSSALSCYTLHLLFCMV